ncbi:hypothetical protein HPP92_021723 [Vanilla planifolia]|uniref:Uncharacterized protein n=1 Tax=Vanilla planifolia TaxID=51239 RepID=A0A835UJ95_VANPL|nr:hypothetical protein HPP92_021723 [Vanilla planifolia]
MGELAAFTGCGSSREASVLVTGFERAIDRSIDPNPNELNPPNWYNRKFVRVTIGYLHRWPTVRRAERGPRNVMPRVRNKEWRPLWDAFRISG